MIKRFIFGAAFALAASAAIAADVPVKAAPYQAPPAVRVFDWTGFYGGLHIGYQRDEASTAGLLTTSVDPNGLFFGGQIGFNYQVGSFVYGIELDLSFSNSDGATGLAPGVNAISEFDYLGTLRAKIGYAFDRVLIYGTGGLAFAGAENGIAAPGFRLTDQNIYFGWSAGVGIDYAIARNWTVGLLYLHRDYGSKTNNFVVIAQDVEMKSDDISLRVNYRF